MSFLIKHKLTVMGMIIGAIAGYMYYKYVGCANGTCSITSRPLNSTVYGALLGALLFTAFKKSSPGSNR